MPTNALTEQRLRAALYTFAALAVGYLRRPRPIDSKTDREHQSKLVGIVKSLETRMRVQEAEERARQSLALCAALKAIYLDEQQRTKALGMVGGGMATAYSARIVAAFEEYAWRTGELRGPDSAPMRLPLNIVSRVSLTPREISDRGGPDGAAEWAAAELSDMGASTARRRKQGRHGQHSPRSGDPDDPASFFEHDDVRGFFGGIGAECVPSESAVRALAPHVARPRPTT